MATPSDNWVFRLEILIFEFRKKIDHFPILNEMIYEMNHILTRGGGGGTSGISGWGCAAGTLEPLAYTRASSAEFCNPILE